MHLIRQLFDLFDRRERLQLVALALVVLLGSVLEILGIGLVLPFMRIVSEPGQMLEHARFGPLLRRLGLVDREAIILAASLSLVFLFALKNAYLVFQWRLLYRFIYTKLNKLSVEIFRGYLRSPYVFHLERNTADLIRNLSWEVKLAFTNVVRPVVGLAAEAAVSIGILLILFLINPVVALTGLGAVGLLSWTVARMAKRRLTELGGIRGEEQGRKYQLMQQGLGAIKEIRVLGREAFFLEDFRRSEGRYVRALWDSQLLAQYPRLAIEMVAVAALAGITTLLLLSGRELTEALATLALFGVAVIRLVPAATKITSGLNQIRFYSPSVEIVHAERRNAIEADREYSSLNAGPPVTFHREIGLDAVSYGYPGTTRPAVSDLTVTIPRGECVGFVGASAAGKTTLLHLLLGLLQPTSGRILVDGADIRQNVGSWQRRIGYIPQDLYLLDDTIRRNVAFGVPEEEIDDEAVWRALEAAQLASSVGDLGDGLDAFTGERGARMSGGQAQRLAIARALYGEPEVLILDEATSSLDYETEARIVATLRELAGRKTLIIVSHRDRAVRDCDVLYLLEEGRLAASGTFEEIFSLQT